MDTDELRTALHHAELAHAALVRAGAFDFDIHSAVSCSELIDDLNMDIARSQYDQV